MAHTHKALSVPLPHSFWTSRVSTLTVTTHWEPWPLAADMTEAADPQRSPPAPSKPPLFPRSSLLPAADGQDTACGGEGLLTDQVPGAHPTPQGSQVPTGVREALGH